MSSDHIIEVSEANFPTDVVEYSKTIPVVVDFWAEWCQPCHALTPILEKLAKEANGSFRLAMVNADENPNLNFQLNITSLPTVKAFHRGQLVKEFSGLQTEEFVRKFIRSLSPTAGSLELERAAGLLRMQNWDKAASSFRNALKTDPDNNAALLGLAKSLLAQGDASGALVILRQFPAGKEFSQAESMIPLAQAIGNLSANPAPFEVDDLAIMYQRALQLITKGNFPAAADGLLAILREDKNYWNGEIRQVMVGLLELMGDDHPETRNYRNELASVLF